MARLHIKYRPRKVAEIIGNTNMLTSLVATLRSEDRPHSYLLSGPSGCGKTTIARIIAKAVGCMESDLIEYNAANTRGIDTIREMGRKAALAPNGKAKLYLLDECHQITGAAAEALLKQLEDTPKHVYYVLATTQPEKLDKTTRNRCAEFTVSPLSSLDMAALLNRVYLAETGKDMKTSPHGGDVLRAIVQLSDGSPRAALMLLNQVIDMEDKAEILIFIKKHAILLDQDIRELARILLKSMPNEQRWQQCKAILATVQGKEAETIRRVILGYMMKALFNTDKPEFSDRIVEIMGTFMNPVYDSGLAGLAGYIYVACKI